MLRLWVHGTVASAREGCRRQRHASSPVAVRWHALSVLPSHAAQHRQRQQLDNGLTSISKSTSGGFSAETQARIRMLRHGGTMYRSIPSIYSQEQGQAQAQAQTHQTIVALRCFHSTPKRQLAVRQRRRKRDPAGILLDRRNNNSNNNDDKYKAPAVNGLDDNDNDGPHDGKNDVAGRPIKTKTQMTTQEFRVHSAHLISRIHAALVPLGSINPDMILSRGRNELHDNEQEDQLDGPSSDENTGGDDQPVHPSVGEYLWIDLGPLHGQYTIQSDETMQIVMLLSPISGQRVYRYSKNSNISNGGDQEQPQKHELDESVVVADPDPNRWMCTDDGHVLEGLLVRDLIRQIQGVPNL
jgi:hypothetical protein